jgi:hypothetical protein
VIGPAQVVELTPGQLAAGGVPLDTAARMAEASPLGFLAGMIVLGLAVGAGLLWASGRCSGERVSGIDGETYGVRRSGR